MNKVERFYEIYSRLKPDVDPDYENIPDELVDLEIIEDRLWSADVGDEFWSALIEAYEELGHAKEIPLVESRLQASQCVEVADGFVFAFLSRDGFLRSKAGGASSSFAYIGGAECRLLAHQLRHLAAVALESLSPGRWDISRDEYVAVNSQPTCAELTLGYARELADRLESYASTVPPDSPPLDYGRSKSTESMDEVHRLARSGHTLAAVAMYRKLTGANLKLANDAVEELARTEVP